MTVQRTRAPIFTDSPGEDSVNVCLCFLSAKTSRLGAEPLVGLWYPSDTKVVGGRKEIGSPHVLHEVYLQRLCNA